MILSTRLYVGIFIAIVLTGALGYGVTYPTLTTNMLSTCDTEGLNDSNFLAGCTAPLFDDYEHGAYYFGLEQTAIAHLQRAEVLVLGDSKAMFAFSTQATVESFRNLGARYHLMGFGAETSRFALALMQKYKLRPKAVIINADPFFYDFTQYENILSNKPGTYLYYVLEKYFLQAQRYFCSRPSTGSVLCGKNKTIYRAKIDGSWQLDHYVINPQSIPVPPHKPYLNWSGTDLVAMARKARPLLPLPDRCIISHHDAERARDLARNAIDRQGLECNLPGAAVRRLPHDRYGPPGARRCGALVRRILETGDGHPARMPG